MAATGRSFFSPSLDFTPIREDLVKLLEQIHAYWHLEERQGKGSIALLKGGGAEVDLSDAVSFALSKGILLLQCCNHTVFGSDEAFMDVEGRIDVSFNRCNEKKKTGKKELSLNWQVPQIIPMCLYPSPFPENCFYEAVSLMKDLNRLVDILVCKGGKWMVKVLESVAQSDPFIAKHIEIYERVYMNADEYYANSNAEASDSKTEYEKLLSPVHSSFKQRNIREDLRIYFIISNYMLDCLHNQSVTSSSSSSMYYNVCTSSIPQQDVPRESSCKNEENNSGNNMNSIPNSNNNITNNSNSLYCLKQVEINTISSSFGCQSDKISEMHRFLVRRLIRLVTAQYNDRTFINDVSDQNIDKICPTNNTIETFVDAIAKCHFAYLKKYTENSSAGCFEREDLESISENKDSDVAFDKNKKKIPTEELVETGVLLIKLPEDKNEIDQRHWQIILEEKWGIRTLRMTMKDLVDMWIEGRVCILPDNENYDENNNHLTSFLGNGREEKKVRPSRLSIAISSTVGSSFCSSSCPIQGGRKGRLLLSFPSHKFGIDYSKVTFPNKFIFEVSVVYFRALYAPFHFHGTDTWKMRELIEWSNAAKLPSIPAILVGTKKVQETLFNENELERFIENKNLIQRFMRVCFLQFDPSLPSSQHVIEDAIANSHAYILKSKKEGGTNFDGMQMVKMLKTLSKRKLQQHVLVKKMTPPLTAALFVHLDENRSNLVFANNTKNSKNDRLLHGNSPDKSLPTSQPGQRFPNICSSNAVSNVCMSDKINMSVRACLSELGVYGCAVYDGQEELVCTEAGHVLRSKGLTANEGGVSVGASALDSPLLVESSRNITSNLFK